jgi:hypothetical protein
VNAALLFAANRRIPDAAQPVGKPGVSIFTSYSFQCDTPNRRPPVNSTSRPSFCKLGLIFRASPSESRGVRRLA